MKVIGIIPARYASTRFPGKPLIDLKGKSMIQRVYEGAMRSELLSSVIVATDDKRIEKHVEDFGGKVMLTDENHQSGTDRCGEIAAKIDADVIINIQGDEPLIEAGQLDSLLNAFNDSTVEIATIANHKVTQEDLENKNRIKVVTDKDSNALYFSRSAIPNSENYKGDALKEYPFLRHIGLYAYRKETLLKLVNLPATTLEKVESLEQLRWLYNGFKIKVIESQIETPNIDAPEDVNKVLALL